MLIASIQDALIDADLQQLGADVASGVGRRRSHGVLVDLTALDVMDSFAPRPLGNIARTARLRGARTVVVGIQPDVACAVVQLGLTLPDIRTALELEEGLALLAHGEADAARDNGR